MSNHTLIQTEASLYVVFSVGAPHRLAHNVHQDAIWEGLVWRHVEVQVQQSVEG